ncbi:MAG: 50S ribosomal protein L9 [Candidatus Hydrogenedentes bacterium]|nr:50S ribosomal protein L9 [Candidatus Hydrogenedentota bacterium]
MKVILCEDVDNLGDMGETVNVAPGYARNYLLPRRLAVHAESASAKQIEHEMRIIGKREQKRRAELVQVAGTLEGVTLEFTAKAGAEGKLFGSITNLHISNKLAELGHQVNRRKIQLAEPLKSLGEHAVSIQLTSGVGATIKVIVEAEEPESGKAEKKVATTEAAPEGAESSAAEEPSTEEALSEVIVNTGDGDESAGEPATS